MSDPEIYGDWRIWHAPAPFDNRSLDWHFAHKDATEGDCNSGSGPTREACIQHIVFIEDMDRDLSEEEENSVHRAMVQMREMVLLKHAEAVIKGLLSIPVEGDNKGFIAGVFINMARNWLADYEAREQPLEALATTAAEGVA